MDNVRTLKTELDRATMRGIFDRWGETISEACKYSSLPPEFLASLIANESGGNPDKTQFDADAYRCLWTVRAGAELRYLSITQEDLLALGNKELRELATSWGLTQIKGNQVLRERESPRRLLHPVFNLHKAVELIAVFCEYCQLDPRVEFADLFRCWKTGRPDGTTLDREYVEDGLRRLVICRELTSPSTTQPGFAGVSAPARGRFGAEVPIERVGGR